jgi:5-methylcytosine-specific restriction endonuclease McrA
MCYKVRMKRSDAKAAGLMFYDNGKLCPQGHTPSTRYTSTGKCLKCCKSETPRYRKKRAAHAAANSAKNVARMATWKKANPERATGLAAAYRERHRPKLRAKSVAYRKANPTDPIVRVVREARRRTRKLECGGSFTKSDVARLMKDQRGKCAYCRTSLKAGHSVDHVMPLVLKGSNDPKNLQLLCKSCNSSKGGKHPVDFARRLGLLL